MRVVVCDTGPVLHLHEAKLLDWLIAAGEILIPFAVEMELARLIPDWAKIRPDSIRVHGIKQPGDRRIQTACREAGLHAGEAEALVLARQLRADWVLTDDAMARAVAELTGFEVHGSLGLVLWRAGHVDVTRDMAATALDRLAASSLWVSEVVLAEARAALDKITPP